MSARTANQRFGGAASSRNAGQVIQTKATNQILIFSLLKIRKKTAATLSGVAIALATLWGLAMWQDISPEELVSILLSILLMLALIISSAVILIALFKLGIYLLHKVISRSDEKKPE